jgi:betaine-homocysteine S-methyltransferase
MAAKKGLLERLAQGPVIGDGGFVFALEKRGYVKAGPWTPESAVEDPEAVRQLHREFLRAGADVMQAFTFYASEDKLTNRGNKAGKTIGVEAINRAAAKLAKEVADEGGALTLGGISQCPSYLSGMSKADVQKEFKKQIDVFVSEGMDFLLCEYYEHIEEMEWAIEECLRRLFPWPPPCASGRRATCTACPQPSAASEWPRQAPTLLESTAISTPLSPLSA